MHVGLTDSSREGQTDVEVTPESSPVHESISGSRREWGPALRSEVPSRRGGSSGANETVRLAVAGLNGRGGAHVDEFGRIPGVEITYLVDPDTRTYKKRLDQIEKNGGRSPTPVQDIRRVLDDKSVDAVSVATPNHWHALITIWALPGGQGRVRRKTVQPQRPRRPSRR